MSAQNTSHAVMAQRVEPKHSLDDFPTPPWATRALMEHIIRPHHTYRPEMSVLEPACGRGHMAHALKSYFATVGAADIVDYGYGSVREFNINEPGVPQPDWIITNPPFNRAADFVEHARGRAGVGVAMLVRSSFAEGVGRFWRLYQTSPPSSIAQFTERVPMVRGRVDKSASTATSYAWFVWCGEASATTFRWIPPCRRELEREGDYDLPPPL